ncbi:MAG: VCBS repeat-containing protein, partial [Deltaproteobacteria bacterium]|nr:VCBS repeat-containing protein [Deltaproteobacteria bacterium]
QPQAWTAVGLAGQGAQAGFSQLATLDSLSLPDGWNTLRLRAVDGAQATHEDRNVVKVRNVFLASPSPLQSVSGTVTVTGSAAGNLGFTQYELQWAAGCNAPSGFTTFHASTAQVQAVGALGTWNTAAVTPGPVTLRLRAQFAYGTPTDDVCVLVDPQLAPGFPAPLGGVPAFKSPKLADLDGDGISEIIVGAAVLKANGSPMTGWTSNPGLGRTNSVVFDVNGDGALDVVGDDHDGSPGSPNAGNPVVYAWNAARQVLWSFPVQNPQAGPGQQAFNLSTLGSLSAGDVDGDGDTDVVFTAFFWFWNTTYETTVFVLDGTTGTLLHSFPLVGVGQSSVALADLDGDGAEDLVADTWYPPTHTGHVHAVRANGTPLPGWPQVVPPNNVQGFGNIDPVIADVNRDGQWDIWVGPYLFSASGADHPGFPSPLLNRSTGCFAPMDADCALEMVGGGGNSVRTWAVDGTGLPLHAPGTFGENLLVLMAGENGAQGNPVVADVDGDGALDVLRPAELGWTPGGRPIALYAGKAASGGPVANFPKYVANPHPQGWTDPLRPTAAVGDVDNDGLVDVVQVANGQVYLWHLGKPVTPATKFWPMFQRDLKGSGRLKQGLGTANLLAVDYVQGRLFDVDGLTATVSNPRPTSPFALGLARDGAGTTWMITETTGTSPALLKWVDPATGTATTVAPLSGTLREGDLSVDPATGTLYLLASPGTLYTVGAQSGALTQVGAIPGAVDANGLSFDGQGNLYALDGVAGVLYRLDPATGAVLGQMPMGGADAPLPNHKVGSLAWDAASGRLYTTVDAAPTPALYTVDPLTGFVASVGAIAPANHVSGLVTVCQ